MLAAMVGPIGWRMAASLPAPPLPHRAGPRQALAGPRCLAGLRFEPCADVLTGTAIGPDPCDHARLGSVAGSSRPRRSRPPPPPSVGPSTTPRPSVTFLERRKKNYGSRGGAVETASPPGWRPRRRRPGMTLLADARAGPRQGPRPLPRRHGSRRFTQSFRAIIVQISKKINFNFF